MAVTMHLIRRRNFTDVVSAALLDPTWPSYFKLPFDAHGRAYYRAYGEVEAERGIEEFSFAMEHAGEIVALVECDNVGGILGRFGCFPIEPRMRLQLPFETRRQVVTDILAELKRIAHDHRLEFNQRRHNSGARSRRPNSGRVAVHGNRTAYRVASGD